MASPTCRRNTRALAVFWSLMVGCGVLTAVCVHLAGRELDRPWVGFSLNAFGHVMQAHNTGLVFFDTILAVEGQSVPRHAGTAAALREVLRRTPVGTPLTYRARRGATELDVVVPVQQTTWRRLTMEFGMPLLVSLGQLGMGALVFLLRPNTPRSWRFLGFCVAWFGLFLTIFDFQSTHVLTGKFHIPRKVGNSFLGQGTVCRHCPLCRSLYLRLWLTRRPCVRLFLRATRARSVPVLFRSGVRSGLYLRACRAQSADAYAHTRTVPASPDPLAHGRSPAAVAERS
jgi:hypothetical protein